MLQQPAAELPDPYLVDLHGQWPRPLIDLSAASDNAVEVHWKALWQPVISLPVR